LRDHPRRASPAGVISIPLAAGIVARNAETTQRWGRAWPSLAAGLVLTWARALGEFGGTITFAGNLPGVTQTMPLAIYISQSSNMTDEAIALSLILVLVSLVVMVFRRDRSGAQ
jgi:ABC-type sulfate transport system permease component